jgi:hypothetical protein
MKRSVIWLAMLASVSACAGDSADGRGGGVGAITGAVSNPPPPAIDGYFEADVSAGDVQFSVSSGATGLSLSRANAAIAPGTIANAFFHFMIIPVEYNANAAKTSYWMNFPTLPTLPPNPCVPATNARGLIMFTQGVGVQGQGVIYVTDSYNGGFWAFDLAAYNSGRLTSPFISTVNGGVIVDKKIPGLFCKQTGVDGSGNPVYQSYKANKALFTFYPTQPTT